jgi:hypothetical protein
MKKIILLISLLVGANSYSHDCLWAGSFLENSKNHDIIFKGKVVGYDIYRLISKEDTSYYLPTVLIVEIEEIIYIKKDTSINIKKLFYEEGFKLRIICNVFGECRPSANKFKIDSKWIFQLNSARVNYYKLDYTINGSSTNYLKYEDNIIFGNIEGKNQEFESDGVNIEMDYEVFKEKVLNAVSKNEENK